MGSVDRRALPAPRIRQSPSFVSASPPANQTHSSVYFNGADAYSPSRASVISLAPAAFTSNCAVPLVPSSTEIFLDHGSLISCLLPAVAVPAINRFEPTASPAPMASFLATRALAAFQLQPANHEIPLTPHEALSGIAGYISLAAWIFVLIPQLVENYRAQSSDGVSLLFLFVWFIGDATNLAGAIWADLVPTVIAIAVYFCFLDLTLGTQCLYYKYKNRSSIRTLSTDTANTEGTEEEPLLSRRDSNNSIGLPGSHRRRRSSAASMRTASMDGETGNGHILPKIVEEAFSDSEGSSKMEWIKNIVSILSICVIGAIVWAISWKTGLWKPSPAPGEVSGGIEAYKSENRTPLGAEVLGYLSAVLYLGARIPQIIKNWQEQSCEGLSLLFFLLSLLGNLTYGAGILFHSLEKRYIITNLPWLIGSLGTMAEDVTIFVQFHMYGEGHRAELAASEAIE